MRIQRPEEKLDHSNVINSNNIVIEEDRMEARNRNTFNIIVVVLVFILLLVIILFVGSFINGDKVLGG